MVEWWALIFVAIGIGIFVIDRFLTRRKFKKGVYGWYRSGLDGVNAKAHCFFFTGERVPFTLLFRYSFCGRKYLGRLGIGNWERIEDPTPDIMCTKCMDYIRKKSLFG